MRVRTIFWLWLPLAISFELMMLEGPALQGAIGRLPDSALHLAAWGLMLQLSLLIESPVIMLLSTAIALVKDAGTFYALRRFMLNLLIGCTLLTAAIAFTPLFDLVASRIMGQPAAIVAVTRPALRTMLLCTAAIGWRRFFQGILVRNGATRMVSWGTSVRLCAAITTAVSLTIWGKLPGVQVGACALMAAVLTEAVATTLFALPVVRAKVLPIQSEEAPPTQREIWQFHLPLAATTVLTLLALPLTSAALARLPSPKETLAAWAVASMAVLVLRGWGLAIHEITVSQARDATTRPALYRFAWIVGLVTSGITALLVATPLLTVYFRSVVHLPTNLYDMARLGVGACVLLPLITALASWARGMLVAESATGKVYRGMGLNLALHGAALTAGVLLNGNGMLVAAGAFTLAAFVEFGYLAWCVKQSAQTPQTRAVVAEYERTEIALLNEAEA